FGLWAAIFAIATRQYSWVAMVLLLRATSFVFVGAFVASRHIDLRVFRERIVLALGTTVGILDTLANGLFARGIESGYASLAAPVFASWILVIVTRSRPPSGRSRG